MSTTASRDAPAQRQQRQQRGGRSCSPGPATSSRRADLLAVQLGQPVDGLGEQLRRLVRLVPALVELAVEAEVRRQVHHLQPALAQLLDRAPRRPCAGRRRAPRRRARRSRRRRTPRARGARGSAGRARRGAGPRRARAVTRRQLERRVPLARCRAQSAPAKPARADARRRCSGTQPPPELGRARARSRARRSATSSSVSVRSGARNSSRSASDLLPSPTCSPR